MDLPFSNTYHPLSCMTSSCFQRQSLLVCIMSGLISWALAGHLRLGEAIMLLGLLPGQSSQLLYYLWFLWNLLCGVLCNGQWLPSWVTR